MTKVKICGITLIQDAVAAVEAGADYIGLIMTESPRRVSFARAREISAEVGNRAGIVGVFAEKNDLIEFERSCDYSLDYYQVYFDRLGVGVRSPSKGWIVSTMTPNSTSRLQETTGDLMLFDFKHNPERLAEHVGSCEPTFVSQSMLIAGSLNIDNVAGIVKSYHPFGVDCARGTEVRQGVKDHRLLGQFIARAKNAAN